MSTSPEYEAAIETHNAAIAVFDVVRKAYTAGTATDDEYFAARAIKDAADDAFEVAFAAESNRAPESAIVADDDVQLNFAI